MSANRQQAVQAAQRQIANFEATKRQLMQRLATAPANLKGQIQNTINQVNQRIAGAKGVLQKLISAVDVVKQIPGGQQAINKAGAKVGSAIDKFLEKYGNKSFEIVRTPKFSLSFPTPVALIGISGSANMTLSGALSSTRSGATITSQATLSGSLQGSLAVTVGFKVNIPVFGSKQVGLEGGINLSANATGKTVLTLQAAGTDLSAKFNPADINISASASLYLKWGSLGKIIDSGIQKFIKMTVLSYIKGASLNGNQIDYPLGSAELLIIKTPTYSLTFSIAQARFAGGKEGGYSCRIHDKLKARLNALKKGLGL
jgi:hypothetical protein